MTSNQNNFQVPFSKIGALQSNLMEYRKRLLYNGGKFKSQLLSGVQGLHLHRWRTLWFSRMGTFNAFSTLNYWELGVLGDFYYLSIPWIWTLIYSWVPSRRRVWNKRIGWIFPWKSINVGDGIIVLGGKIWKSK